MDARSALLGDRDLVCRGPRGLRALTNRQWEPDDESRSGSLPVAARVDRAAVQLDEVARDRQAEAQTAVLTRE